MHLRLSAKSGVSESGVPDTDAVGRLLLRLSAPPVLTALAVNVVSLFTSLLIGRMDIRDLTVLSIISPLSNAVRATLLVGLESGTAAVVARYAGDADPSEAKSVIHNGMLLVTGAFLLYAAIVLLGAEGFMRLFTPDASLIALGVRYARLSLITGFFWTYGSFFQQSLMALGFTGMPSAFRLMILPLTVVLNLALVAGQFGLPSLGLMGSAWSGLITEGMFFLAMLVFTLRRKLLRWGLRPEEHRVRAILRIALPYTLQQGLATVLVSGFNGIVSSASSLYVTVVSIFYSWNGLDQAMLLNASLFPVIGSNLTRGRTDRVRRVMKLSMRYTLVLSGTLSVVMLLAAPQLLQLFNCPAERIADSAQLFRLLTLYVLPMNLATTLSNVYLAFGDGIMGMLSLLTQTVFTLGGGLLLMRTGFRGPGFAFFLAEYLALAVVLFYYKRTIRHHLPGREHDPEPSNSR